MCSKAPNTIRKSPAEGGPPPEFTETTTWVGVGEGWHPLHGGFRADGYSVEWHDFSTTRDLDWTGSFHPGGLEICLNLSGRGQVWAEKKTLALDSCTAGFYAQSETRLAGRRLGGERHQFMTVEFSLAFLEGQILGGENGRCPHLGPLFSGNRRRQVVLSEPMRLTSAQRQIVMALRRPPVFEAARPVWYKAKALEIAAAVLYRPAPNEELFCQRQKRLSQERAQKVLAILNENLAEPPSLEEMGRRVACSHFYLSRIFTQEMGKSISAHLRDLRMERAAVLLREGRMNVTEVALEVGYSSLSHFSTSFHQTFGCCPGLYPLVTVPQVCAQKDRKPLSEQ